MPAESLAALVAVSQAHRSQVHHHVSQIAIPDYEHMQTCFRGGWPCLSSWQIGDKLQPYPDGTQSGCCTSIGLRELRHLTLCESSMTAASIAAQVHCVSWSTLQSCRIKTVGLSCAGIYTFCTHTWPALLQLDLSNCQLDSVAISHLAAGCWPSLTTLNLHCTGLAHAALQQLCSGYWPAVAHLNFSRNNLSYGSVSLLAPSPHVQPAMKTTDWAAQLKVLDLSASVVTSERSLTALVTEQLTKIYWPCLEHLSLRRIVSDVNALSHLVHGRWPKLSVLDIRGPALGAPAMQMLAQAPWRHLRYLHLTANLQDAAVCEQLTAGQEDHDQQLLRYLQLQDAQPNCIMMRGRSLAVSCVEGHAYMQLPKCFAQWLELNVYVEQVDIPLSFS